MKFGYTGVTRGALGLTLVVRLPGVPGSPRRTRRRLPGVPRSKKKMFNGKDSDMLVVIVGQYCSA